MLLSLPREERESFVSDLFLLYLGLCNRNDGEISLCLCTESVHFFVVVSGEFSLASF